jgi:ABC-type uncharacterized transport system ATPase subunit
LGSGELRQKIINKSEIRILANGSGKTLNEYQIKIILEEAAVVKLETTKVTVREGRNNATTLNKIGHVPNEIRTREAIYE